VLFIDVADRDKDNGYTALMFAAQEGDEIIVDVLLACVRVCVHVLVRMHVFCLLF